MNATTIKLENPLLKALIHLKPRGKSISGFVREIIGREIERKQMIKAAEEYAAYLGSHPDEREWLEDWENADLASPVKKKRKRGEKS